VKQWLESEASGNWILVLDNADNKLHFFPNSEGCESPGLVRYIPRAPKGVVVVTTRDFEVATQLVDPVGVLMKEAMELNDAEVLFKSHHPSGAPHNSECINLLRELQCLPLAITQVASYLEMNRQIITVSEHIGKFRRTKENQRQLLSKSTRNPWRSDRLASLNTETVLATFTITFRQIQLQSPLADSILRMVACIDYQKIPHGLIAMLDEDNDDGDMRLREALAKLHNFSLLQVASEDTKKCYTVHPLVHLAMQVFLTPEEKDVALVSTEHCLVDYIPESIHVDEWPSWRIYLANTMAFLRNTGDKKNSLESADICSALADYLCEMDNDHDSQNLAQRAV
jgi:hypothetical protein